MTHQPGHHGPGHQPRYHGADEDLAAPARPLRTALQRRTLVLVIAIVIAVLLAILIMHLTGAMPKGTDV